MSVASVGFSVPPMSMPQDVNPQAAKQDTVTQDPKVKSQLIDSATADLQRIGNAFSKALRFEVDHHSQEVIVKVIDKETDKVIRELPPEELQRLSKNLKEAIGLLFDEMV